MADILRHGVVDLAQFTCDASHDLRRHGLFLVPTMHVGAHRDQMGTGTALVGVLARSSAETAACLSREAGRPCLDIVPRMLEDSVGNAALYWIGPVALAAAHGVHAVRLVAQRLRQTRAGSPEGLEGSRKQLWVLQQLAVDR